ncbi:hypothetical protein N7520_008788 [Penicillium odoratum]|uniref:uncharacterized protein n=1 Tax=Penicillium odoratum TaxID=1167516 RepID=UPI0025471AD3|nr:uncharacterized protein N7520_008788 [Penicillium odoratum]KAJ5751871.1 hypothetical protein N7520_008788 [Penicillium odoratum]
MAPTWQRLNLQQTSSPPLLFQYTWTRQGYALCVTDLTSIWTERLSHQEILARAEQIDTTIDPSEDQEQFNVFLVKVGEGLRGDGGSATLNSGAQADSLVLRTSSKLPTPMRPLKWTLYLSKEISASLTDRLLLPLLRDEAGWESRQRVLLDQLKQKDWVLGKLFDKFEALGADLGTVFPGAVGMRSIKKGSTRLEAAKFIKGLAPFDEAAWLCESGNTSESSGLAANILNELARSGSCDVEKLRAPQEKWWNDLQKTETPQSEVTTPPKKESASSNDDPVRASQKDQDLDLDEDGASTASEDEFQRQETPLRLKAQKEKPTSSPHKSKEQESSKAVPEIDAGEATASDSEPETTSAPLEPTPTPQNPGLPNPEIKDPPKKAKVKGSLGVIGGKKKKEEKQPSPLPAPPSPSPPASSRKARAGRLGTIGGKKTTNKAPEVPKPAPAPKQKQEKCDESPDLHSPTEVVPTPGPKEEPSRSQPSREEKSANASEESEEQRTIRKREELKRQLEEKSKAPKKKRRF